MTEKMRRARKAMKEALLSIIKDENRIITDQIDPQYLSDNLGRKKGTAEAVVFPVSTEEVSGVMHYAWENNLPVTPRGAGTNLVGSTVPSGHGIVLDVSLMNHVLELDEETFTATVDQIADTSFLFYRVLRISE